MVPSPTTVFSPINGLAAAEPEILLITLTVHLHSYQKIIPPAANCLTLWWKEIHATLWCNSQFALPPEPKYIPSWSVTGMFYSFTNHSCYLVHNRAACVLLWAVENTAVCASCILGGLILQLSRSSFSLQRAERIATEVPCRTAVWSFTGNTGLDHPGIHISWFLRRGVYLDASQSKSEPNPSSPLVFLLAEEWGPLNWLCEGDPSQAFRIQADALGIRSALESLSFRS